MARELTPTALFFKWFLVPLFLAAFGFFVIGPRYGGQVQGELSKNPPNAAKEVSGADSEDSDDSQGDSKMSTGAGPEIEVTAKPVSKRPLARRRETKKPKKKPAVDVDPGSDAIPVPPEPPDKGTGTSGDDDG